MTKREYSRIRSILTKIRRDYDPQDLNLNFFYLKGERRRLVKCKKGDLLIHQEAKYNRAKSLALSGPRGVLP